MFSAFKRPREDDDLVCVGEHETKKSRPGTDEIVCSLSLPRPSFISSPPSAPLPTGHREEKDQNRSDTVPGLFSEWRGEKKPGLQSRRPPTLKVDTAMDIDMAEDPFPLQNGDNLSPWQVSAKGKDQASSQPSPIPHHLVNQALNLSGGRAATPIYGHFTLNMRPTRLPEPINNDNDDNNNIISSNTVSGASKIEEADWWRRRQLPSPISESGDVADERLNEPLPSAHEEDTPDTSAYPDSPSSMNVNGNTQSQTYLQVPEQSIEIPARLYTHDHDHDMTDIPASRAPRGKISFAMGYRADCEKCRMKVPGHYSHIVRS